MILEIVAYILVAVAAFIVAVYMNRDLISDDPLHGAIFTLAVLVLSALWPGTAALACCRWGLLRGHQGCAGGGFPMTRNPIVRHAIGPACHQSPCGLPYHQPGQRVQWQIWRDNGWRWNRGTVLAHTNRTLVVQVGDERVTTSCGPVMAEVGK